jgi:hypothetical protein
MTFHLSRGQLIGRLDLTTPLEAERPGGCPSGHIAAPLTSAIVIREAAQNAGAEARVLDASKQHRTAPTRALAVRKQPALAGMSYAVNGQCWVADSSDDRPTLSDSQIPGLLAPK